MKPNARRNTELDEALKDNKKLPEGFKKEDCVPTEESFAMMRKYFDAFRIYKKEQQGDEAAKDEFENLEPGLSVFGDPELLANILTRMNTAEAVAKQVRYMLAAAYIG